jgi:signal transduction histidine kinase/CheY-like chemotaxis protein
MNSNAGERLLSKWIEPMVVVSILVVIVLAVAPDNYLLFHCLVEFFSIVVAFGVFTVFWNSRHFLDNGCFLFIGIGYLFVGLIDLFHTLAYDKMGVFQSGPNLATQLWVAARYVQAGSLLAAPLFLRQRFDARVILVSYVMVVALLLTSIFYWNVFPTCFVPGGDTAGRLTLFKIASEYIICLVMAAALALLYRRRDLLDPQVFQLLALSILVSIASEFAFTFYTEVDGTANRVGHCLKMVASYWMYVAFVKVGLTYPYSVLFRNMRESEHRLREMNETLEARIAERTLIAEQRAAQLRALASELALTEQRERRRLAQVLHDHLQQILVAAKLKIGLLKKRIEVQEQRDRLQRVDELLDESIGVSRSLTVELSPPVLYDAGFSAALEWLARHMREKHGFCVQVEADPELEPATEDLRVFLFDAVRELLFNVVKHGGTSEAVLRVGVAGKRDLEIVVEDRGVGMLSRDSDSSFIESGFGLFSIRERLELLRGRMEIDSTIDQGTRIILVVPDGVAETSCPPKAAAWGNRASNQSADGSPEPATRLRILLADDHKMFRKGLASLLQEHADLEVTAEAGDGRAAVKLAQELRPDVIVMDISMPQMGGIEATRRVREFLPDVRVVGLSMHEEDDMAQAMLDAGADVYLRKDGSLERLVEAIRNGKKKSKHRQEESDLPAGLHGEC